MHTRARAKRDASRRHKHAKQELWLTLGYAGQYPDSKWSYYYDSGGLYDQAHSNAAVPDANTTSLAQVWDYVLSGYVCETACVRACVLCAIVMWREHARNVRARTYAASLHLVA